MMLEQFENGKKFDSENSLQDFDAKEMLKRCQKEMPS